MPRYRTIDSARSLPPRDLLSREKALVQQARLGQSVRLRYLVIGTVQCMGVIGYATGAFTTPWYLFFVFGPLSLASNVALDITRRRGAHRDWHFWAMMGLDTLLMAGNTMAVGRLGYLGIPFFLLVATGHSLGLPRAARIQIVLACLIYPFARAGGLLLDGASLTLAAAGVIGVETICLAVLGWLAIIGPIRFTVRLRRARRALDELSTGAFETRLPAGALDDIGFLAVSFNRAAEMLAETRTQLVEQERELRQVHKLEAVGRLAGGVAHDFNNYLTVVLANLELASTELPATSPAHADIREAVRATRGAAELTQQLLAFGRKQILKPEIVDLRATVEELSPVLSRLVGPRIHIATDFAPTPCLTRADASQLAQVVLNLATNARDAMTGSAGTLTITVRPEGIETARSSGAFRIVDAPVRLRREVDPTRDWVMLSVRDTGAGMDADTLARVFEPFFTTKEIGRGNGLGLATVHGIVAQSGGAVAVESTRGVGTTFSIYLPAAPAASVRQLPRGDRVITPSRAFPKLESSAERSLGVVLLVEDEAPVRVATRRILERAGYQVLEAADGQQALACFASREPGGDDAGRSRVQILVTDLIMPNIGGIELATRLRATRPDLPVILLSGYSAAALGDDGLALPGARFISKPPQRHELAEAIAGMLNGDPAVATTR